mmetsp:Transcript_17430/g.21291  ORF Transcript_17430/g.21291 Transcript_17430/m.21291 type:complete len:347 (+) Transcript_17430:72-1112(+)
MIFMRSFLLTVSVWMRHPCLAFSTFPLKQRNQHIHCGMFQASFSYLHSIARNALTDEEILHDVNGISCREVHISIETTGKITVLEATADSQNDLVDLALATEEEIAANNQSGKLHLDHQDPYGAVLWPAASAVANHLLTNVLKDIEADGRSFQDISILELGAGTGLVSISAALGGASKVIATDYEGIPLQLLEFAARNLNHKRDGNHSEKDIKEQQRKLINIETFLFDICDHDVSLPKADIIVAADIMYEPKTGICMAHRVVEALKSGSRVIVGCSPGRPGRPKFTEKLQYLLSDTDVEFMEVDGTTCSGPRNDLICGKDSSSISSKPKLIKVALLDLDPSKLTNM